MGEAHEPDPPIGHRPTRVQVLIDREWIDATAHGRRTGSHGTQLLIFHAGRYTWIHTARTTRPRLANDQARGVGPVSMRRPHQLCRYPNHRAAGYLQPSRHRRHRRELAKRSAASRTTTRVEHLRHRAHL
jgi:hypothetical protein